MTTVTISLPESLKEFVEDQVRTKGYGNVSEYFRGLLREAQARETDEHLERLLLEALDDPQPDVEVTPEYWVRKRSSLLARLAERKRRSRAS